MARVNPLYQTKRHAFSVSSPREFMVVDEVLLARHVKFKKARGIGID